MKVSKSPNQVNLNQKKVNWIGKKSMFFDAHKANALENFGCIVEVVFLEVGFSETLENPACLEVFRRQWLQRWDWLFTLESA